MIYNPKYSLVSEEKVNFHLWGWCFIRGKMRVCILSYVMYLTLFEDFYSRSTILTSNRYSSLKYLSSFSSSRLKNREVVFDVLHEDHDIEAVSHRRVVEGLEPLRLLLLGFVI